MDLTDACVSPMLVSWLSGRGKRAGMPTEIQMDRKTLETIRRNDLARANVRADLFLAARQLARALAIARSSKEVR